MLRGYRHFQTFRIIIQLKGTQNMGRIFLDHPGGTTLYSCANCDTALTNRSELTSMVSMRIINSGVVPIILDWFLLATSMLRERMMQISSWLYAILVYLRIDGKKVKSTRFTFRFLLHLLSRYIEMCST